MFEKCVYLTLVEGGQKKEDQSQQIPLRCGGGWHQHVGHWWINCT